MQLSLTTPATSPPPKSAEILRAVRKAFMEKGFDGASMQDLARAAGMSVGNFYRYFPSKAAIVEQMVALDLADIEADFAMVLQSPQPMEALRRLIAQHLADRQNDPDSQLWAEMAAAAQRKPEIAQCMCRMEGAVGAHLLQVFALETGLGFDEIQRRFAPQAGFIMLMVRAAAMFAGEKTPQSADLNPLIMRSINNVLAEISSAGLKG